ncbi:MAG: hypothetical protein HY270_21195 [Deltaproteobacteria bacterium]|nr:hypothetical protein [Deltaproteobacteria bacterium]
MQRRYILPIVQVCIAIATLTDRAAAVPSFSRQTLMPCSACHSGFPEITAFARDFKLNGYTLSMTNKIEGPATDSTPALMVSSYFPLSVMLQSAFTRSNRGIPDRANNDFQLPQQLSLFLAGEIAPHLGLFVQATYSQSSNTFSMDNTDIRYADRTTIGGKNLVYGLDVNNNPGVEDLWNTGAAWSYPFAAPDSDTAVSPTAGPQLDGALAQQVMGVGGYLMLDNHWYVNSELYRSAQIGGPTPPNQDSENVINGVSPYWRLAWHSPLAGSNYLMLGHYGLYTAHHPKGVSGPLDELIDIAFDGQFEHTMGSNLLSAHAVYIYEGQNLHATTLAGGSAKADNHLNEVRVDAIYHLGYTWSVGAQYFYIFGNKNDGLYSPGDVSGSANGSPNSDGFVVSATFFPWQNIQLKALYKVYTQFNGRAHNYDGSLRSAADNDTLYLLAWLAF